MNAKTLTMLDSRQMRAKAGDALFHDGAAAADRCPIATSRAQNDAGVRAEPNDERHAEGCSAASTWKLDAAREASGRLDYQTISWRGSQ
jgi:hypothetical protein